ncbi:MAG: class I SAM-dependent methyltransferase [Bdellovibrionales bacterium]|nr:class I SAM-dependent methyltransferase [Bdellovibrionales bacterium]
MTATSQTSNPTAAADVPFELSLLEGAQNYSQWIYSSVEPFMGRRIMELGAGIGNLTQWLPRRDLLVITEADDSLITRLRQKLPVNEPNVVLKKIDLDQPFAPQVAEFGVDTIVSFNVMEHIEDHRASFREQVEILRHSPAKGPKRLVAFVPAHQFAYGSYDSIFKHFRRYEASGLRAVFREIDPTLKVTTFYFNLMSLPGWILNGRILKSTTFSPGQIKLVERIIPFWKPFDYFLHRWLGLPIGQSVVVVAEI